MSLLISFLSIVEIFREKALIFCLTSTLARLKLILRLPLSVSVILLLLSHSVTNCPRFYLMISKVSSCLYGTNAHNLLQYKDRCISLDKDTQNVWVETVVGSVWLLASTKASQELIWWVWGLALTGWKTPSPFPACITYALCLVTGYLVSAAHDARDNTLGSCYARAAHHTIIPEHQPVMLSGHWPPHRQWSPGHPHMEGGMTHEVSHSVTFKPVYYLM